MGMPFGNAGKFIYTQLVKFSAATKLWYNLKNKTCISFITYAFSYPCLCLCLGFSQITLITPFLLITLHLSQIFFTDGLTFIFFTSTLYFYFKFYSI